MTTPIDRAAKVLFDYYGDPDDKFYVAEWEAGARAALASTREPTPEMIEAGAKLVRHCYDQIDDYIPRHVAREIFIAMHDAMMTDRKI